MEKDRRQNVRHPVIDDVYAALGRNYSKVGKLINISIGGLAFEYIAGEATRQSADIIDIFIENTPFGLYNLPCTLAYDNLIKAPNVKNQFTELLTIRCCGVRFGRLGKTKQNKLSKLISVHTA